MTKFSYLTIVIGTTCLLVVCLVFGPAATQADGQSQSQAANAKDANRQRIPVSEMRRVTSAAASGSLPTIAPLPAPESKSSDSKAASKRATTKRIGSDHTQEHQRANFQVRMMHAEQQAQQAQSQQQQQQQPHQQTQVQQVRPHPYFMNPPDSWQPQSDLMSPFGDQESNDEMTAALASEIDATEAQLKQAKSANLTALPAVLESQKYRNREQSTSESTVVSNSSLESSQREKQLAASVGVGSNSGNGGKRTAAGLSSKDDYYGSEEEEDEEPEPSAVHQSGKQRDEYIPDQQQQQQQQTSRLAQDSRKAHDVGGEKFRAVQESEYSDYTASSEEGYRKQAERTAVVTNGTIVKSAGLDNGVWAPSSTVGQVVRGQAASQQQVTVGQKQQPAPTKGTSEKVSEFLSSGPLNRADVAIEYIRNILKSKQSSLSSENSTSQQQQASSSSPAADSKPQSDVAATTSKSLLRLSSFASRLNQILNNTSSKPQTSNGDKANPSTPLNEQTSSSKEEKHPQQMQPFSSKSFLAQQTDAKFSVGDVKPAASILEPMYQISPSASTSAPKAPEEMLAALLPDQLFAPKIQQHQKQERPQQPQQYQQPQQQQQQQQQAVAEELTREIAGGALLGGDYMDNLDEFPRQFQQQLYRMSVPIATQPTTKQQEDSGKPNQYLQPASQPIQQQAALAQQGEISIRDFRQHQGSMQLPGHYQVAYQPQQSAPGIDNDPRFYRMQRPSSQPAPGYLFSSQNLKPYTGMGSEGQGQKQGEYQVPQSQQADIFDSYIAHLQQNPKPISHFDGGSQGQQVPATQTYTISSYNKTEQSKQSEKVDQESKRPPHNPKQLQPQNEQKLSMISSKQEHLISTQPQTHLRWQQQQSQPPQMPQQQYQPQQQHLQQPVAIRTIEPPTLTQAKVQPQPQQYQRPSKTKPPKVVSYFDSSATETVEPATSYQLGDSLYGSNGSLEQSLSQAELEAIQSQFLTAEHQIVSVGSEQYPGQQQQDAAALAAILSGLKPGTIPSDMLQRLTSPGKQAEEVLKGMASNEELVATMVPVPSAMAASVPVAPPLAQPAPAQLDNYNQQQQQQGKFQSQLEQEEEQTRKLLATTKSAGLNAATDFDGDVRKKSLIVYLNHPRPVDMSKVSLSAQESYNLAQTVANEQSMESFISAKEFDSAHGLSKDSKQLDISLSKIKDGQDKDGLSVVVIGDAYKYKKIVLLISSKSGGLKFIPMVKDMKK